MRIFSQDARTLLPTRRAALNIAPSRRNPFVIFLAIAIAAATAAATSPVLVAQPSRHRHEQASSDSASSSKQPTEALVRQGPLSISHQHYSVLFTYRASPERSASAAPEESPAASLSRLEILDAQGKSVYQEAFPSATSDGRFAQTLTASASLLTGKQGTALVIRFLERHPAAAGANGGTAVESWQIFGVVNGQLETFGAVLPLGKGTDIAVGGVVTAVMLQGGIAVMPLASTAEQLEFPVWAGNFYLFVPVLVDWAHGQWSEGEECYQLGNGSLRERGCSMRVEAAREPQPSGTGAGYVRLFASTNGDTYNSVFVSVHNGSRVDFPQALAIVQWEAGGGRVECSFKSVWLQIRIDGKEGWVRGEQSFEALGLRRRGPP